MAAIYRNKPKYLPVGPSASFIKGTGVKHTPKPVQFRFDSLFDIFSFPKTMSFTYSYMGAR